MAAPESDPLPTLVSAAWLAAHLNAPDLVVLDCSWYLPAARRDPQAEYLAAHIPGALRFELDAASDPGSPLPHMLPSPDHFAAYLEGLGIQRSDRVVCYDGSRANLSAARVWWMFRVFGHPQVAVLDGGFAAWSGATRTVQRGDVHRPPTGYPVPVADPALVRSQADVERIGETGTAQVVDCRPAARFRGEADEPRPQVRRGHIPGSMNVPYSEFTDRGDGLLRPPAELLTILRKAGVDLSKPIVALCGSGTSAASLALVVEALRAAGTHGVGPPVAIYDGSWAEWGREG